MDPSAAAGVPAHVTLLWPFMPPSQLDDGVRERLRAVVGAERPFPFVLAGMGRWPDVVYLSPEPSEPFRRLIRALSAEFPDFPPYGGAHDVVVPHVTIAHDDRPSYLAAAEHALPTMLPVRDVAREAWLIAHDPGMPWAVHWRLPLGAGRDR